MRRAALEVLKNLPLEVLQAHLPEILERLGDKDSGVRRAALEVLKNLPSGVLRPHLPKILDKALEDEDPDVRKVALEVLEDVLTAMGSEAAEKRTWDPVAPPLGFWRRLWCIVGRGWKWFWKRENQIITFVASVLTILMFFGIYTDLLSNFQPWVGALVSFLLAVLVVSLGAIGWAWRKGVCEKAGPEAPQCDQEMARRKEAVPAPGPRTP